MHYLGASWDPSLRLEQPARDVGDLPWSMVLCIFPCVPVFSPESFMILGRVGTGHLSLKLDKYQGR